MSMCSKLEISDKDVLAGFHRLPPHRAEWVKVVQRAMAKCVVAAEPPVFVIQQGRITRIYVPMCRSLTPREKHAILDRMAVILGLKPAPDLQPI